MTLWEMDIKPGVKVRLKDWKEEEHIELLENYKWVNELCKQAFPSGSIRDWEYYVEPKKKKKITQYRYTVFELGYYHTYDWTSSTLTNKNTVLTETREIEVDG